MQLRMSFTVGNLCRTVQKLTGIRPVISNAEDGSNAIKVILGKLGLVCVHAHCDMPVEYHHERKGHLKDNEVLYFNVSTSVRRVNPANKDLYITVTDEEALRDAKMLQETIDLQPGNP